MHWGFRRGYGESASDSIQYYDPETDLFENWHRYYDATTGRYLEPDPIWKYPEQLVPRLAVGHFDPVYAYGANNPLKNVDPSGEILASVDHPGDSWGQWNQSVTDEMVQDAFDDPKNPMHEAVIAAAMADTIVAVDGSASNLGTNLGQTSQGPNNTILVQFTPGVAQGAKMHQQDQFGKSHVATSMTVMAHEFGHVQALLDVRGEYDRGYFNAKAIELDNAARRYSGITDLLDPWYGHGTETVGGTTPPTLPQPSSDPTTLSPAGPGYDVPSAIHGYR